MKLFKTEEEKLQKYIDNFREKYIPEKYNQCELLDELTNKDLTYYVSISNRSDGKSMNYIHFFIRFSIDFNVKFALMCRHWTLRNAFENTIIDIVETFDGLDLQQLRFNRADDYVLVMYGKNSIGIIYDLNNASDLKLHPSVLKKYPIIIYDEFLALESDYVAQEYEKFDLIYTTTDKLDERPYIHFPKVFLLGNAVNFSSPILSGLDLFNILEVHKINTAKIYDDVFLENRYNKETNKTKNLRRMRGNANNALATGQFTINSYMIATNEDKTRIETKKGYFYIKIDENNYLLVTYNKQNYEYYLSLKAYMSNDNDYFYNVNIADNKDTSVYLKESYYSESQKRKYSKGLILFDNAYSKNTIVNDSTLSQLKIMKCISQYEGSLVNDFDEIKENERINEDNKRKQQLKRLYERFANYE